MLNSREINGEKLKMSKKFYEKTWFIVFSCVIFPPAGIFLIWKSKKPAGKNARIFISAFLCLWTLALAIGEADEENLSNASKDHHEEIARVETESKENDEQDSVEKDKSKQTQKDKKEGYKESELQKNIKRAIESIGMDYLRVKNIKKLDDWSSGTRCSFVYDGFRYIVYVLGNGEIESINTEYKRSKIYERGYEPLNYKDFEPDINVIESLQSDALERISKYIIGEKSIKSKIGSMLYSRIYDYYSISGEVKAKNTVSKKDFTFTVDYTAKDGEYECVYFAIDGKAVFGSDQTPKIEKQELKQEEKTQNGKAIVLSDGKKGKYGQYDSFNGERYLRYHIPSGKYKVKCNVRGGFYIETIELHEEDGYDTATTIQQINMSEGEEIEISIEDGQCISLIINTEIELIKR